MRPRDWSIRPSGLVNASERVSVSRLGSRSRLIGIPSGRVQWVRITSTFACAFIGILTRRCGVIWRKNHAGRWRVRAWRGWDIRCGRIGLIQFICTRRRIFGGSLDTSREIRRRRGCHRRCGILCGNMTGGRWRGGDAATKQAMAMLMAWIAATCWEGTPRRSKLGRCRWRGLRPHFGRGRRDEAS